jgi:hypothetical protein
MDKFEQFFKDNRLLLDTEDLDNARWERINGACRQSDRRFTGLFRTAAVIAGLVLLGIALYFGILKTKKPEQRGVFAIVAAELANEETTYLTSINLTMDSIRSQRVPADYSYLFKDFMVQLDLIDKQYDIYKRELEKHGYNEEVIQQVIYNYQLKLSVLHSLQSEIAKINNLPKKEENENKKIRLTL